MSKTTTRQVLAWLAEHADPKVVQGMARYAIPSDKAYGIAVGDLRRYAKTLGKDHELALALWQTDRYEARMLATFLDDPTQVSATQMDAWSRDFDSWAICDTACFHLFDRTAHAWRKVDTWSGRRAEFQKRAAFALIASLSVHDKRAPDAPFLHALTLIEAAASDERNFVKKAVNWALRSIGKRKPTLHVAASEIAARLAESPEAAARWIGKDALRDLASAASKRRLAKHAK